MMDRDEEAVAIMPAQDHLAVWCGDDGELFWKPVEAWVLYRDGTLAGVSIGNDGACYCEEDSNFIGFCRTKKSIDVNMIFNDARSRYIRKLCSKEDKEEEEGARYE